MIDFPTKAQEIQNYLFDEDGALVVMLSEFRDHIAAALEAEYQRGRNDMSDVKFEATVKFADAEGYRRGLEEAKQLCGTCLYARTEQGNKHKTDGHLCPHLERVKQQVLQEAIRIAEDEFKLTKAPMCQMIADRIRQLAKEGR
jgi:tRNA U34 2-thiouridine synthase MnmA/TrmU